MKKRNVLVAIFALGLLALACGLPGAQTTGEVEADVPAEPQPGVEPAEAEPDTGGQSGDVVTEDRPVSGFDGVSITNFGRLIITQGDVESLTVEARADQIGIITAEVTNGTLELFAPPDLETIEDAVPSGSAVFRLTVDDLAALNVSGFTTVEVGALETGNLALTVSGISEVAIDPLDASTLVLTADGDTSVGVAGSVESQTITLAGIARYEAADLQSQQAIANVAGEADAVIWVSDSLILDAAGEAKLEYYGNPSANKTVGGNATVTALGAK